MDALRIQCGGVCNPLGTFGRADSSFRIPYSLFPIHSRPTGVGRTERSEFQLASPLGQIEADERLGAAAGPGPGLQIERPGDLDQRLRLARRR